METYLLDLIKYPELNCSKLEELLKSQAEKLIKIPPVETPLLIGRSEYADICITPKDSGKKIEKGDYDAPKKFSEFVSRIHALLVFNGNSVYVKDAGSVNGTYINGHRISSWQRLRDQDRLILRPYVFKVLIPKQYKSAESDEDLTTVDFPVKPEIEKGDTVEYQSEDEEK